MSNCSSNSNSNSNSNSGDISLRANLVSLYQNAQQKSQRPAQPQQHENQNSNSKSFLKNPHSILSLDQKQLSQQLQINNTNYNNNNNILPKDIIKLRKRIACTIVQDDTIGNRKYINITSAYNNNDIKRRKEKRKIPSAITAHELYNLSSSSFQIGNVIRSKSRYIHIHTGSYKLNQLISKYSTTTTTSNTSTTAPTTNKNHRNHQKQHNGNNNNNGIELGTITEICGISSSGKTQLALTLAANALLPPSSSSSSQQQQQQDNKFIVEYITGGGGNTSFISLAKRFRQLCNTRIENRNNNNNNNNNNNDHNKEEDEDILNRIQFIPVNDNVYHLLSVLNQIEKKMNEDDNINNNIHHQGQCHNKSNMNRLIIIDSISGCLSSSIYTDGDGGIGIALMNEISLIIRRLSRWKKGLVVQSKKTNVNDNDIMSSGCCCECAIVITNGMVSDNHNNSNNNTNNNGSKGGNYFSNKIGIGYKPALGELWRVADIRLILHPIQYIYDHHNNDNDHHQQHYTNHHSMIRKFKKKRNHNNHAGLKVSSGMIVNARLEKHYMKYCHPSRYESVQFGIDYSGIIDL